MPNSRRCSSCTSCHAARTLSRRAWVSLTSASKPSRASMSTSLSTTEKSGRPPSRKVTPLVSPKRACNSRSGSSMAVAGISRSRSSARCTRSFGVRPPTRARIVTTSRLRMRSVAGSSARSARVVRVGSVASVASAAPAAGFDAGGGSAASAISAKNASRPQASTPSPDLMIPAILVLPRAPDRIMPLPEPRGDRWARGPRGTTSAAAVTRNAEEPTPPEADRRGMHTAQTCDSSIPAPRDTQDSRIQNPEEGIPCSSPASCSRAQP